MSLLSYMIIVATLLILFSKLSNAIDTLALSQSVADGRTLTSKDGGFELGFFSPGNSKNYYLGIWYKNIPGKTIVWVANRSNPMNGSSGLLMIDKTGNLALVNNNKSLVWSSNVTTKVQNPVAQLLDSGNLVIRDGNDRNSEVYLWQSFDYPTDTLLPNMKLGINLKTGLDRNLTAWKNWDDPSPGDQVAKLLTHNLPEAVIRKSSKIYFRLGPWNGIGFSGYSQLQLPNQLFVYNFVNNVEEIYYYFYSRNRSVITRLVINQTNNRGERSTWNEPSQSWNMYWYLPLDYCDNYGLCGAYGNCRPNQLPVCNCLKGFSPKSPEKWSSGDWSQGCIRNRPLNCSKNEDGFIKFTGLKWPDSTFSWADRSMNLDECKTKCLLNCSCTAYTNLDIRNGGIGCALWFFDLIDIREISSSTQNLYIRMSASEIAALEGAKDKSNERIIIITIIPTIILVLGIPLICYYFFFKRIKFTDKNGIDGKSTESTEEDLELPFFDLNTISQATNNFSNSNKLGQGGFGPVYKGTLQNGQEVAVKKLLSSNSGQGSKEFKTEVKLIAKLQHRNLVKLLGYCIQGNERMLIYEYMPNKSLDFFIFDETRGKLLDWSMRFSIICGIARGLLYLHQDSRLRIIHRDLKAANVLLDNEMNPKISDFGLAKSCGADQTEGNTNRVVGTYGYMAPEYATDGLFSVKSDVFSFGVLMLEIISGKKSRGFCHPDHSLNLIGYAWTLWKERNAMELIAPLLRNSCNILEARRSIHISLLCVQQNARDRPTMASVVIMLGSEITLPQPKEPGFFKDRVPSEEKSSSGKVESSSTNEMSISLLEAR